MARPANADPARTRARLLGAAAEQFSRRGVEAASLRDVARAAGVSLATIHYYFGDKDALYSACLDHAYTRASRELEPMTELIGSVAQQMRLAATTNVDLTDAIAAMVRTGFRLSRQHRALVQLIMRPVIDHGELESRWRDASLLPFLEQMSVLLAQRLGRPVAAVRLDLQSLVSLTMRYSLSTPAELARVAGLPPDTDDETAVTAIEDYLVDLVHRLAIGVQS